LFNAAAPAGLGNPNHAGTGTGLDASTGTIGSGCFGTAPHCFTNPGPFINTQSFLYWSGTEYAPSTTNAWIFNTGVGGQFIGVKVNGGLFVWPVRSGQSVVAPPEACDDLSDLTCLFETIQHQPFCNSITPNSSDGYTIMTPFGISQDIPADSDLIPFINRSCRRGGG